MHHLAHRLVFVVVHRQRQVHLVSVPNPLTAAYTVVEAVDKYLEHRHNLYTGHQMLVVRPPMWVRHCWNETTRPVNIACECWGKTLMITLTHLVQDLHTADTLFDLAAEIVPEMADIDLVVAVDHIDRVHHMYNLLVVPNTEHLFFCCFVEKNRKLNYLFPFVSKDTHIYII